MEREREELYHVESVISVQGELPTEREREIRNLMKLNNMFIIHFFATFTHEGEFYVVPKLCTHSIVHFDIKPENILVEEADTIKIGDMGSTKKLSEMHTHTYTHTHTQWDRQSHWSPVRLCSL